jgi:PAS domain S-box-containing protein
MAWLARIALCVGGIYMFLSILSAVQESGAWRIPLERALHQHQALYRAALESISDSFLAMDSEFRLTYINKRALGYGGACAEEVLGRTLWEAFPTILGTPLEEFYRKAMAARQPMTYTNPSVVARGHHFELHAYPAEDGLTVFGRDITERKRAEEALRDAEREKSLILDNANEIIAYHDCANNLIWANKAYLASTSLPLADLKGRKCYSCWGLDRLCENCPVVTAIRTGQPQEAELTPQDQPHWPADQGSWLVRAAPVRDDAGNVVGAIEVAHDITARKKAEAELAAAHRLMQDLIDNTTSMIFVCDLEERFVLANAPLVALLKTTQAQLIGKRRHEFMPQADADAHEAHDRKVIAAGRPVEFEESSELNGRSITWLSMKFPLRDAQGRIYGVAGIVTDISERKRAEEQLRESEEKLRSVMESMSEGVVVFDATGKITYQNPASVQIHSNKLFGERQRFDSLTVHWEVRTYPDGSLVPSERWAIPRILRGESIHSEQFFVDCVDDPERSFIGAYSGSPIYGSREKIVSGFLTIRDITQQKQAEDALRASEERFRQVVETLPQLVWTCRADGPCDYLSPQWVSYTGIPQAEQLGYRWLEQLHPDDRQRAVDQWQATATLGKTFVTEFRIRRHDGIYRWFRTLAVPLRDDGGRVVKWFGTNTDIQDIRELAAIATQAHAFGLSFRQPPQRPATDSGSVTFGVPER